MKNIKQNFNANLYREGLRRMTLTGSLFLSLMMIGAVMGAVLTLLVSYTTSDVFYTEMSARGAGTTLGIGIGLLMPFFSALSTLILFSFLNKRNSSDFFHSIPHKRKTIFWSFFAALLTWIWGSIISTTLVTVAILGIGAIFGVISIPVGTLLLFSLVSILPSMMASLLIIAVVLLAMSLTGNVFSNIVTALLIMFLPRVLISALTGMVVLSVHNVVGFTSLSFITNPSYNIAVTMGIGSGWRIGPLIYTFVLAVIYLAVAARVFNRRKSEMATNPASNRRTQLLIRTSLATAVAFPAAVIIFAVLTGDFSRELAPIMIVGAIAAYLLAIVVYFAYEFISRKRVANFARLLPGLALVMAINIMFSTVAFGSHMFIVHRTLDVDNVRSVQIHDMNHFVNLGWQSYELHNLQNLRFDDEEIVAILVRALNTQLGRIRRGETRSWYGTTSITFNTNLGAVRRNIPIELNCWERLREIFFADEEFVRIANTMPSIERVYNITTGVGSSEILSGIELSQSDMLRIYQALREDMRSLCRFEMQERLWDWQATRFLTIWVHGYVGRHYFVSQYTICEQTPRAAALLFELVNAQNYEQVLALWDVYSEVSIFSCENLGISRRVTHTHGEAVRAAIRLQGSNPVDTTQPFFMVTRPTFGQHQPTSRARTPFFFNSDCPQVLALFMPASTR